MRITTKECFVVALGVENNARRSVTNLNVFVRHLTQAPLLFPVVFVFVSICVSLSPTYIPLVVVLPL